MASDGKADKTVTSKATKRWNVDLPKFRADVVEATSKDAAWEAFKARHGILASDHVPTITEVVDGSP